MHTHVIANVVSESVNEVQWWNALSAEWDPRRALTVQHGANRVPALRYASVVRNGMKTNYFSSETKPLQFDGESPCATAQYVHFPIT